MENKDIKTRLQELQGKVVFESDEEANLRLAEAILETFPSESGKSRLETRLLTFDFESTEDVDLVAELYERLTLAVEVINCFATMAREYNHVLPIEKLKKVVLNEITELWKAVKKRAVSGNRARYVGGLDDKAIWVLAIKELDEKKHVFKYINKELIESIIENLDRKEDSKKGPVLTDTQKKRAFTNILSEKILKDQGIIVKGIQDFLKNY